MPGKPNNEPVQYPRPVRSFVRREGRTTLSQHQALKQLWPKYGIEYSNSLINLDETFVQPAPVSIDIGFGNGMSTLYIARLQPNWNHLGIEVYRSGVGSILKGASQQNLHNVRVIYADAFDVLTHMISDQSVDRFLVFFPDPWPKNKHHKRRLIQPEFSQLMSNKLKFNGIVHLATDWKPYAEWMLKVMGTNKHFINVAGQDQYAEKPEYCPVTKFEKRGKALGHDVFDLIYKRI